MKFAICALLVAMTWAVYAQTLGHDFVNYDDDVYAYRNPYVFRGLTFGGAARALTHFDQDNWHPLTPISHMIDCQLFGLKAAGHHFTNVLLHSIAAVLLFILLEKMTSALWPSAFVGAVFAVHPLHVESVAWISERKDVLSGVFFMLTLLAHFNWTQKQTFGRYLAVSIWFACGLMSKPMLVTVPVLLLLIDYWPLRRLDKSTMVKLVVEKIPLFALSAAVSVVTLLAQGKAMPRLEELSIGLRVGNAARSYVTYLWEMIWPVNLALAYPHPGTFSILQVTVAAVLLVAITWSVIVLRQRCPYLITGWCWYLIMLLPVIGLIQVGAQAHADRYTYLPQIGLSLAVTWVIVDLTAAWPRQRAILSIASALAIATFMSVASVQASWWRDSETLWRRALAVNGEHNDVAHFYLGEYLLDHNRTDEALREFEAVVTDYPDDAGTHFNIGNALLQKGELEKAMAEYQTALKIEPSHSDAETTLANILLNLGQGEEALVHYRNVLARHPDSAAAHYNLGRGLFRQHRLSEAIAHYRRALAIEPDYPDAAASLTEALLQTSGSDNDRFRPKKP